MEFRRRDIRSREFIAFCDAHSAIVPAEHVIRCIRKPARVAKLKRDLERRICSESRGAEEVVQSRRIRSEVGGKLKQQRAEFTCNVGSAHRTDKLGHVGMTFPQALKMGNSLWGFEAEPEFGWRRVQPALQLGRGRQCPEGVIDLNRGQLACVELQKST